MKKLISVIGSDKSDESLSKYAIEVAKELGKLIAKNNAILICGGRGGIMEAVCKGAKTNEGITVGILPKSKTEMNDFVDIPIVTGLGNIRNSIIVYSSDAIVAIAGRWGTLNEISYSMIYEKPIILIKGTGGIVDYICNNINTDFSYKTKVIIVDSAKEAIMKIFNK